MKTNVRNIIRYISCQIIPASYFCSKYIRIERTNQFNAYKAKSHLFQKPKNKTYASISPNFKSENNYFNN